MSSLRHANPDKGQLQLVGQEAEQLQKDALLARRAGEHGIQLVNDDHPRPELAQQSDDRLAQVRVSGEVTGRGRVQGSQQLVQKLSLGWLVRHQHDHHRPPLRSTDVVVTRRQLPLELADQHGLAHPALANEQDVLHPLPGWLGCGLVQIAEHAVRLGMLHPAFSADVGDPLLHAQRRQRPDVLWKMRVARIRHQNSTPLVSPSAGIGTRASVS